jgi:endonuclease YncB( thermonuclease family)
VVPIADGDVLTVLDAQKTQHCIRLNWIDAPLCLATTR